MASEQTRILDAMLRMKSFAIRDLTEEAAANYHTVRTVLARHKSLIEVVGRESGSRGKPANVYALTQSGRARLESSRQEEPGAPTRPPGLAQAQEELLAHSAAQFESVDELEDALSLARGAIEACEASLESDDLDADARADLAAEVSLTNFLLRLTESERPGAVVPTGAEANWLRDVGDSRPARFVRRCVRSTQADWLFDQLRKVESSPPQNPALMTEVLGVKELPARMFMDGVSGTLASSLNPAAR